MIDLSIIIVNYRSANLIIDCLRSVYQFTSGINFEVIVVDNSNDENREKVIQEFADVLWFDMNYNAGFARANNAGIKESKGKIVLLLNPDTIAFNNCIGDCYKELQLSQYIVAAGVQLLDVNHTLQISGSFFVKGGLNHLLPIPYWGGFIRWLGYKTKSKIPNIKKANKIEEVDWISGAFLMVKKHAIEKAGLLDEDFFLYAEEVEWCSRLKKTGKLCIFGDLNIIHLEGATIDTSQNAEEGYYNLYDKKGLQLMVSNHLRVRKQYGVGWFLFLLSNYTFGVLIFFVCSFLYGLFTLKNPFKEWKKATAFAKNVARLWNLAPTIISNKPYFYKMF